MKKVDCDNGDTITKALSSNQVKPGDTVEVTGTCTELVTITTDQITLDGQGAAILDGGGDEQMDTETIGVITVDGARRVIIEGFTVQNGPTDGIVGINGAVFTVRNTTMQDNAIAGLTVQKNSTVHLTDSTMRRNNRGLELRHNAVATLRGTITITDNSNRGIHLVDESTLDIRGATIQANNNGFLDIGAFFASSISIGFFQGDGTIINANANGAFGIVVDEGGFLVIGGPDSTINVANNGVYGLVIGVNGVLEVSAPSTIRVTNNGDNGLLVSRGSISSFTGTFLVENNPIGLNIMNQGLVDGFSGGKWIESIYHHRQYRHRCGSSFWKPCDS